VLAEIKQIFVLLLFVSFHMCELLNRHCCRLVVCRTTEVCVCYYAGQRRLNAMYWPHLYNEWLHSCLASQSSWVNTELKRTGSDGKGLSGGSEYKDA